MSLIAWYKLEDNIKDYISKDNVTGAISGTGVTYVNGKIGKCLNFSGSNAGYAGLGNVNSFTTQTSFSLSCWLRIPSSYTWNSAGNIAIFGNGASYGGSFGICREYTDNRIMFFLRTPTTVIKSAYTTITRDIWYHIVGVYDYENNKTLIYCNGTASPNSSTAFSSLEIFTTGTFRLGGNLVLAGSDAGYFVGDLDDCRIYDHALTPKEVKELSLAKIMHYKFDYEEFDVVNDCSGYENNGTLSANPPAFSTNTKIGNGSRLFVSANSNNITVPTTYVNATEWSFSCWAYKTAYTQYQSLYSDYNYNTNRNIICGYEIPQNRMTFYCGSGTNVVSVYANSFFLQDEWAHWVFVYKASTYIRIYKNGIQIAENTTSIPASIAATQVSTRGVGFYTYASVYFNGYIDDARIYLTALTQSDIDTLYQVRASLDNEYNFFVQNIKENNTWDDAIDNSNLVLNGTLQLASNYNWTGTTYHADGYLYSTTYLGLWSDNYIEINPSHIYYGEGEFRYGDATTLLYFGVACYDKNKNYLHPYFVYHYANTETTLAQPISNGDTTIYITSATNWKTSSDNVAYRYFALYDPSLEYPNYTYTRLSQSFSTSSTINNTVTLNSGWTGGSFPAGTAVANANSGTYFSYRYAFNVSTTSGWTKYGGTSSTQLTGWGINEAAGTFRYGTKYIRMLMLLNYTGSIGTTTHFRNIRFWNTTASQIVHYPLDYPNLSYSGVYECDEINEVAPSRGLIAYWNFDGNILLDCSENANHLTISGAPVSSTGIKNNGVFFDGIDDYLYRDSTNFRYDALSCSFWIKTNALGNGGAGQNGITGLFWVTFGFGVNIYSSGIIVFSTWNITYNHISSSGHSSLLDNVWHHIVVSYDNQGNKKIYIDSIERASGQHLNKWNWTNTLFIADNPNNTLYKYYGNMDEIRVYNRGLTQKEVDILYTLKPTNMYVEKDISLYIPNIIEN